MRTGAVTLVGTRIGAYLVGESIGVGGMGAVYQAEQAPLGRPVALKVIHDDLALDPAVAARFLREAKIASSLRNPNTVTIYDFGQSLDGRLYMAMELLEGETLAGCLRRRGSLPVAEAVLIAAQICRSLAEAHGKAIVHRDLKCDNVFLTTADDGTLLVKVLDYGIAHAGGVAAGVSGGAPGLTQQGMVVGTPAYMAPEQARAEQVDGRSDLYALGIILFEMLAGRTPFEADNPIAILGKVLTEPVPLLSTLGLRPPAPPRLEELVASLVEKDRGLRPPSALAVQSRLRGLLEGREQPAAAPAPRAAATEALGGLWGLPEELGGAPAAAAAVEHVTVAARTPPAASSAPPSPPASAPAAPASRPSSAPPRPSRPAPVIDADASPFEHEIAAASLEVDRRIPAELDVPLAVRRHSSLPPRPRPSHAPRPRAAAGGGVSGVAVVLVLAAVGAVGWFVVRPRLAGSTSGAATAVDGGMDAGARAETATPPEPAGDESSSALVLARAEAALRTEGFAPEVLPAERWAGTYDLDGGTLRLFAQDGRIVGTFESALRSGRIEGRLAADGALELDWRSTDTGAIRGAELRTGKGLLRVWTHRRALRLLGTWGYGARQDGGLWLATPRARPRAPGR